MAINSDTSEKFLVQLNEKSCASHLFRHASEITRETKGGYLEGFIDLPPGLKFPVYCRVSLVPIDGFAKDNPFSMHPNLLHINMKLNKKNRLLSEGEMPEDVDWFVMLKITEDHVVHRVCGSPSQFTTKRFQHPKESSAEANSQAAIDKERQFQYEHDTIHHKRNGLGPAKLPEGKEVLKNVTKLQVNPTTGELSIALGNRGLMLNVITPLQKFSKGGATISDVIRQRFQDIWQVELSHELLTKLEDVFTKNKEDRLKLQQVRLLFEIFNPDKAVDSSEAINLSEGQSTGTNLTFLEGHFSSIITNSKSKECGPLHLHAINPATSCTEGNTRVFALSFFKLVHDVRPVFVLYDPKAKKLVHSDFNKKIRQPDQQHTAVFNQFALIFTTPPQDWEVIQEIERRGLELHLTAFRPKDGRMSDMSFQFIYRKHNSTIPGNLRDDPSQDDSSGGRPDRSGGNFGGSGGSASGPGGKQSQGDLSQSICYICDCLATLKTSEAKLLPLAKPGVHRRKTEILKYDESNNDSTSKDQVETQPTQVVPTTNSTPIEFSGSNTIVELKVKVEDLIELPSAKRPKLQSSEPLEQVVRIKDEPMDEDEVVSEARISNGHLTMPCPPPMKSAAMDNSKDSNGSHHLPLGISNPHLTGINLNGFVGKPFIPTLSSASPRIIRLAGTSFTSSAGPTVLYTQPPMVSLGSKRTFVTPTTGLRFVSSSTLGSGIRLAIAPNVMTSGSTAVSTMGPIGLKTIYINSAASPNQLKGVVHQPRLISGEPEIVRSIQLVKKN